MRAGLAASIVTPGSTAPPSSRTTPAIVPLDASCAREIVGTERRSTTARTAADRGMPCLLLRKSQIPNPKLQIPSPNPKREATELGFGFWDLGFGIYIGAESSDTE